MIYILAQFEIKNDKISKFIELCDELIQETRKESGCINYTLQQNKEHENHFVFVEQWKSDEDIKKHNSSQHFIKIVPLLIELCERNPIIQTFNHVI